MKKIRILQVVSILDMGGIETMLVNYIKHLDKEKFHVDFLVHRDTPGYYDKEVLAEGCQILYGPRISIQSFNSYKKWAIRFFEENPYDIVHVHLDALSYFPLIGAKVNHVPVRIAHSHVNNYDFDIKYPVRKFFAKKIPNAATDFAACSETAGKFMFPHEKSVTTVINPVDIKKYQFNAESRQNLREHYSIDDDTVVVGHVGRFASAKNHSFMLNLAQRFIDKNYCFIFVGEGPLFDATQQKANDMKLTNVIFTGIRNDVHALYSMFDIFILPSHYEGLGNVAVEAQVSGLPVFISEGVNRDVMITDSIKQLPLNLDEWSSHIELCEINRKSYSSKLDKYDIHQATVNLEQYYTALLQKARRTL